ncbi:MAG: DUF1700 domain-containing protein [Clostridiales bacterium]|nr:DUF1700 domain-containing protein [Clostridiales bacterium]
MSKALFLNELAARLSSLPADEVQRTVTYYSEIIYDRIEDGMGEEEAVAGLGNVSDIADQIIMYTSLSAIVKTRVRGRRLSALAVVLLIIGSPVWLPLLITAFAILLTIYVVLWSVVAVFWSVVISFCAGALGGMISGAVLMSGTGFAEGTVLFGSALICAGLAVFSFHAVLALTKAFLKFTAAVFRKFKIRIALNRRSSK